MDRPWKAPLAQKLIRPSSCTFRISVPGTWLRHTVQRFHASSCAGVFFTVEQATMRNATIVDVGVRMNARRMATGSPHAPAQKRRRNCQPNGFGGLGVDDELVLRNSPRRTDVPAVDVTKALSTGWSECSRETGASG